MDERTMTDAVDEVAEDVLTLEELTTLALAADPDATPDPDARPFEMGATAGGETLMPRWYMPAASLRLSPGWRRWTVVALVALLFGIEFSGLCSAFGQLVVG